MEKRLLAKYVGNHLKGIQPLLVIEKPFMRAVQEISIADFVVYGIIIMKYNFIIIKSSEFDIFSLSNATFSIDQFSVR